MDSSDNESYKEIDHKKLMMMVMGTVMITALQISTTMRKIMTLHIYAISSTYQKDVSSERITGTVI